MALRFTKFSSVTLRIGIICIYNAGVRVNCVTGAPTYRLSVVPGTDIPRNIYVRGGWGIEVPNYSFFQELTKLFVKTYYPFCVSDSCHRQLLTFRHHASSI